MFNALNHWSILIDPNHLPSVVQGINHCYIPIHRNGDQGQHGNAAGADEQEEAQQAGSSHGANVWAHVEDQVVGQSQSHTEIGDCQREDKQVGDDRSQVAAGAHRHNGQDVAAQDEGEQEGIDDQPEEMTGTQAGCLKT